MRKILFIALVLISLTGYSQTVSFTNISIQNSTTGVTGFASTSYLPENVYLNCFVIANTGGTPATVSISGGTWTEVFNQVFGDRRIMIFSFAPSATTTTALTYTYTGTQEGSSQYIVRLGNVSVLGVNGEGTLLQTVSNSGTSANPSITLGAITDTRNGVFSFWANNADPFTGTAEAGWVERTDQGFATPNTGMYGMSRTNGNDITPTVTAASSTWAGVAFEVKAKQLRRIYTL